MNDETKNENQRAIRKAHEVTPPPILYDKVYNASEVFGLIMLDRKNVENGYADLLRKQTIK